MLLEAEARAGLPYHRALGGVLGADLWRGRRRAAVGGEPRRSSTRRRRASPTGRCCRRAARSTSPRPGDTEALAALAADFARFGVATEPLDAAAMAARFPIVGGGWEAAGLLEPDCHDIDVAALHAGFLAGAKRAGATVMVDARVSGLAPQGDGWHIATTAGEVTAARRRQRRRRVGRRALRRWPARDRSG